jgi:hypothetical protein
MGMRARRIVTIAIPTICLAAALGTAQSGPQAGFNRLKSLAGEWEGTTSGG